MASTFDLLRPQVKGTGPRILLIGERLRQRSFNGANKALPALASSLANAGFHRVTQADLERPDLRWETLLGEAATADLVAFCGCLTPQWPDLDRHSRQLREHLDGIGRPGIPLLIGGYAVKGGEDVLRAMPWVSAFFDGEGEEGIVQIADAVARGTFAHQRADLVGLCFISSDGVYHGSRAPRVLSLDSIDQGFGLQPLPAVHDMDIFQKDGRVLRTAQLFTQRGCPWECAYCNKSLEGGRVVRLGEEALRRQLRDLRGRGYEAVYLDVDTFTVSPQAARREADILAEEGFVWGSNTRADRIDASLVEYLARRGCVYLFLGVEHILPEVLLAVDKLACSAASQLEQARRYRWAVRDAFRAMGQAGLPSSYFVILGLPRAILAPGSAEITGYRATTAEEDIDAVRFGLEACEPDYLNLNVLRFLPGSVAADAPSHPAWSLVRPSGAGPITGGYFLPRVARARGYPLQSPHGVYRLCESITGAEPISTAINPERVYRTFAATIETINARIDRGRKPTTLFIDRDLLRRGLVLRLPDGRYWLAPLKEFEGL